MSKVLADAPARTRYNLYRASLLVTVLFSTFLLPNLLANPVQAKQASPSMAIDDRGSRYKICFTATDSSNNLSTTSCTYITVVGKCTVATADTMLEGRVDIVDVATVAYHFGENRTGPEPWNPLDTPTVGIEDVSCVSSYFDQADPL